MSPALSGRQGPKRNAESGKLEGRWCDRVRLGATGWSVVCPQKRRRTAALQDASRVRTLGGVPDASQSTPVFWCFGGRRQEINWRRNVPTPNHRRRPIGLDCSCVRLAMSLTRIDPPLLTLTAPPPWLPKRRNSLPMCYLERKMVVKGVGQIQ